MTKFLNGLRHFFEWLTVYAFASNAVLLVIYPTTLATVGPIASIITSPLALYLVAGTFAVLAIQIVVSKLFKLKNLHKHALFWTYIVLLYVCVLEFVISGFSVALIDNVVLLVGIAFAWLRWKSQTEYLDIKKLQAEARAIAHERN